MLTVLHSVPPPPQRHLQRSVGEQTENNTVSTAETMTTGRRVFTRLVENAVGIVTAILARRRRLLTNRRYGWKDRAHLSTFALAKVMQSQCENERKVLK